MNSALPLSQPIFVILSGLIEERFGLYYSPEDREMLAEKLSPRAIERGFESLLDYYYYLRYDPDAEQELQAVADALVVNETYFAREMDQLTVLVDSLIPAALKERRVARIWSAACATGEEPLTIAALLEARGLLDRVEILATDISRRAIERAQAGEYRQRSLRAADEALANRLMVMRSPVNRVRRELIDHIQWRQMNLLDAASYTDLGYFDAVLCRNVLIYFRPTVARAVVTRLQAFLHPGGYLLVGASESLLRFGTSLECEEHGGAFIYRKVT